MDNTRNQFRIREHHYAKMLLVLVYSSIW